MDIKAKSSKTFRTNKEKKPFFSNFFLSFWPLSAAQKNLLTWENEVEWRLRSATNTVCCQGNQTSWYWGDLVALAMFFTAPSSPMATHTHTHRSSVFSFKDSWLHFPSLNFHIKTTSLCRIFFTKSCTGILTWEHKLLNWEQKWNNLCTQISFFLPCGTSRAL